MCTAMHVCAMKIDVMCAPWRICARTAS
jgi:hypothetical protein